MIVFFVFFSEWISGQNTFSQRWIYSSAWPEHFLTKMYLFFCVKLVFFYYYVYCPGHRGKLKWPELLITTTSLLLDRFPWREYVQRLTPRRTLHYINSVILVWLICLCTYVARLEMILHIKISILFIVLTFMPNYKNQTIIAVLKPPCCL